MFSLELQDSIGLFRICLCLDIHSSIISIFRERRISHLKLTYKVCKAQSTLWFSHTVFSYAVFCCLPLSHLKTRNISQIPSGIHPSFVWNPPKFLYKLCVTIFDVWLIYLWLFLSFDVIYVYQYNCVVKMVPGLSLRHKFYNSITYILKPFFSKCFMKMYRNKFEHVVHFIQSMS